MPFPNEKKMYRTFRLSLLIATAICILLLFIVISIRTTNLIHEGFLYRARAQFDGIVLAREWNARYGGVYVEKKGGVTSSPYLITPDIVTIDHRVYTEKNPALMTREMSDLSLKKRKFVMHITSLNPLNPQNQPDPFERKALTSFESGGKELFMTEKRGDRSYYRYMAPLLVERECLRCHERQGYKVGDVRGGISVTFDVEDLQRKLDSNLALMILSGTGTATLLLGALWFFTGRLSKNVAQARKTVEELAATDGLTGLFNRRHLMERFQEEFERSKRLGLDLGCVMFDIDHFKRVNDGYGHQTGDEVLKRIAALARETIRPYDIAGRFGGEEFIIILPETTQADCLTFAERYRHAVKQEDFAVFGGTGTTKVTVSLGVAGLCKEDASVDDIIKRADDALYKAKADGRDRAALG